MQESWICTFEAHVMVNRWHDTTSSLRIDSSHSDEQVIGNNKQAQIGEWQK